MMAWISGAGTAVVTFVRTRFLLVIAGVAVLVLGVAGVAWAAGQNGVAYVTATATTGSVEETLPLSGTVASASRRDLAFPVAGTVATVDVKVGDRVEAGASLASLETDDLQDAIDTAEQQVTLAEQQLEDDLDSQTSSSTSSTSSSSPSSSPASSPTTTTVDLTAEVAAVRAAQENLLGLLEISQNDLTASSTAVTDAETICAEFLSATLVDEESGEEGEETEPTEEETGAADQEALEAVQALLVACQAAITGAGDAQAVTAAAQAAVQAAMTALDSAVSALEAAASGGGAPGGETPGGETPTTETPSTETPSTSAPSGMTTQTATAADIAADRAAITAAEAEVAIAEADLAAAVLTTPITGTVAQVGFAVGDDVTAGSSTQVITILGDDGYVVEATVGLSEVQKIAVGQTGTAVLPSSGATYDAEVSAVGFVNVSTGSSPEYTVTITVDAGDVQLLEGAAVQIEIQVAVAADVLVIPVSGLHRSETGDSVDVLVDGEVAAQQVEVGAIGAEYAEIVDGLEIGDVVVLADPTQEIESEEESADTGLTGLTSGQDDGGFTIPEGFTPPQGGEGFPTP